MDRNFIFLNKTSFCPLISAQSGRDGNSRAWNQWNQFPITCTAWRSCHSSCLVTSLLTESASWRWHLFTTWPSVWPEISLLTVVLRKRRSCRRKRYEDVISVLNMLCFFVWIVPKKYFFALQDAMTKICAEIDNETATEILDLWNVSFANNKKINTSSSAFSSH